VAARFRDAEADFMQELAELVERVETQGEERLLWCGRVGMMDRFTRRRLEM